MHTDVLVVGGGPAGLAAAIAARLKNFHVTVVESRTPPINKPCGEGLLPEAVAALERLGIELDSSLGFPFAGFRFSDESSSVVARIPSGRAFGLRRTTLHQLLIDRAAEVGVSVLWGARVSGLESRGACVDGQFVPCKWLIGADGRDSTVRRFAGLDPYIRSRYRFGFRRHYAIAPWTDSVEVHWGRKSQLVVTPTGAREVCVSLFVDDSRFRMDAALPYFPEVAGRLRGVSPITSEAGAATSFSRARAVVRGNVALVGDSACTVDSISGQGLSLAFQLAGDLAGALASGDLAQYEAAHRRVIRVPQRITHLLLLMNSSATLRRKVLRLFAAKPALFAKMISVHTGESSAESLNPAAILGLGWRTLWA
jgi:flavin-dependent dehydrogenase